MRLGPSELVVAALTSLVLVAPAYAAVGPAPVAGLGFGAAALVVGGYRAIKRRIGR